MRRRHTFGVLLAATLLAAAIGCEGTEEPSNEDGSASSHAAQSLIPGEDRPEISLLVSDHGLEVPGADDPLFRYMEDKTGVKLNVTYLAHAQYEEQLQLKFAGGYYPDAYQSWNAPEPALVEEGKILVLNELIDRYGPHLKESVSQSAWDAVTVDGNILAIPQPTKSKQGQVLYIRKDWLDKLKLAVPTTSDELLDVMRAFKTQDPNGNGIADEIPYSMRQNFAWGDDIFGMWGIFPMFSETVYNGEIILGSVHPNMVPALRYLKTMYAEGLLDPDFLTNSKSSWEQKIKQGLVGIWDHAPELAWQWQQELNATIPSMHPDVVAIRTPQGSGYDGPVGVRWSPIDKTYVLFSNAKHPEAVIRWLDWLASEEGQVFADLGVEGKTYRREGDRYVLDPDVGVSMEWLRVIFKMHGLNERTEQAWLSDPNANEKLDQAYEIANAQGFVSETIGMPNIENDYRIHDLYPREAAEIIIGNKEPESYLDFIAGWKASGGQKLIDERTRWVKENRRANP